MMLNSKDSESIAMGRFVLETFSEEQIQELYFEMKKRSILAWREKPTFDFIFNLVCKIMEVESWQVQSRSREAPLPLVRASFAYLCVKIHAPECIQTLGISLPEPMPHGMRKEIANMIKRHGSSVSNYLKTVSNYAEVDAKFREDVKYLERIIFKEFSENTG